jgi:hypothetical protein
MKHLAQTGLSMTEAQSMSNILNQKCIEIENKLKGVNNYSTSFKHGGETYVQVQGNPLPENVVELLTKKARYHATQAFLMENIKAKNNALEELKTEFNKCYNEFDSPELKDYLPMVADNWGMSQLTPLELAKLWEAEAYASHIGKFIHKGGILEKLRDELPKLENTAFISIKDGEKTPVKIVKHHTPKQLLELYEELAAKHRDYEKVVNYYKAKAKNMTTDENLRIIAENKKIQQENEVIQTEFSNARRTKIQEAEKLMNEKKKQISSLLILIDPIFQDVINELKGLVKDEAQAE